MTSLLVQPIIALMLLTMFVWLYMYYLRIGYMLKNKIDAEKISTPEQCQSILPDSINQPSDNFKNLFEAPVIFYVTCLLVIITNNVDLMFVSIAWAYVLFRVFHSVIHCTFNNVMARFYAYLISSILMWIMVCKFALLLM